MAHGSLISRADACPAPASGEWFPSNPELLIFFARVEASSFVRFGERALSSTGGSSLSGFSKLSKARAWSIAFCLSVLPIRVRSAW